MPGNPNLDNNPNPNPNIYEEDEELAKLLKDSEQEELDDFADLKELGIEDSDIAKKLEEEIEKEINQEFADAPVDEPTMTKEQLDKLAEEIRNIPQISPELYDQAYKALSPEQKKELALKDIHSGQELGKYVNKQSEEYVHALQNIESKEDHRPFQIQNSEKMGQAIRYSTIGIAAAQAIVGASLGISLPIVSLAMTIGIFKAVHLGLVKGNAKGIGLHVRRLEKAMPGITKKIQKALDKVSREFAGEGKKKNDLIQRIEKTKESSDTSGDSEEKELLSEIESEADESNDLDLDHDTVITNDDWAEFNEIKAKDKKAVQQSPIQQGEADNIAQLEEENYSKVKKSIPVSAFEKILSQRKQPNKQDNGMNSSASEQIDKLRKSLVDSSNGATNNSSWLQKLNSSSITAGRGR